ncbi:PD-(D/E)XK motif protein [Streptomyces sp. NPDC001135]
MTEQILPTASKRLRELLEKLWARLDDEAASTATGVLLSAELQISTPEGPVRLGRDSDGMRHLLVPMSASERLVDDQRSAGVHLTTRTLLLGDALPVRYADVACKRADLAGTFTGLIADICSRIAIEPQGPAVQIARALSSWRLLFGSGTQRWTVPRLAGLFAELLVFEQLLSRNPSAVRTWLGPLGCAQDFRSTHHAIEVKASTSMNGRVIRVHGIDQLEAPTDGTLALAWFRVVESSSPAARTVVEVIDSCRAEADDPGQIDARMLALGLDPTDTSSISGNRFLATERRWYEVDDAFPRIISTSFARRSSPAGVTDIEYSVDLDTTPVTAEAQRVLDRLGADL